MMQASLSPCLIVSLSPCLPISPSPRGRRAFTLIEILGVVVILGIASAILLPQLGSRDDQKAAAAARVVVSDLLYAQNRAIATQKTHYVVFDTGAGVYRVYESISPYTIIKHPVTGQNYQVYFGSASTNGLTQMQLNSVNFDTYNGVAFDALGVPYSFNPSTGTLSALNSGSVVVKSGAYQMTVNVAAFSGELTIR